MSQPTESSRTLPPIVVVVGASGSGKGTVLEGVRSSRSDLTYPVSATTRAPRQGEANGVEYWFLSAQEFQDLVVQDGFVETFYYAGNWYGTLWREIEAANQKGSPIILEVEIHGASAIKRQYGRRSVVVFVMPDSNVVMALWVVWRRLSGRSTEGLRVQLRRMRHAIQEFWWMMTSGVVDQKLINPQGRSDVAVQRLNEIIDSAEHILVKL